MIINETRIYISSYIRYFALDMYTQILQYPSRCLSARTRCLWSWSEVWGQRCWTICRLWGVSVEVGTKPLRVRVENIRWRWCRVVPDPSYVICKLPWLCQTNVSIQPCTSITTACGMKSEPIINGMTLRHFIRCFYTTFPT
jgi:hypothetical protein